MIPIVLMATLKTLEELNGIKNLQICKIENISWNLQNRETNENNMNIEKLKHDIDGDLSSL